MFETTNQYSGITKRHYFGARGTHYEIHDLPHMLMWNSLNNQPATVYNPLTPPQKNKNSNSVAGSKFHPSDLPDVVMSCGELYTQLIGVSSCPAGNFRLRGSIRGFTTRRRFWVWKTWHFRAAQTLSKSHPMENEMLHMPTEKWHSNITVTSPKYCACHFEDHPNN